MRSRNAAARRELLGAAALLLVLAVWCPRTEGQGAPKQTARDDLAVLRSIFPANQPVIVRLRTVPPGQPEVLSGVRIEDVVDLLGARFVRFKDGKGAKILVRSAQIYAIESGGSALTPKVGKGKLVAKVHLVSLAMKPGQKYDFKVSIKREDGSKEPVRISVADLPFGVKADPKETVLTVEQSEAVITLIAPPDAKQGERDFLVRVGPEDFKIRLTVKK
jgi:hypothetical protein